MVADKVVTVRFADGDVSGAALWAGALAIFAVRLLESVGIVCRRIDVTGAIPAG